MASGSRIFTGNSPAPERRPASAVRLARLAWDGLLDLVYPPHCLVCEEHARPILCEECAARFVVPIPEPICAICGRPNEPDDTDCRHCRENRPGGGWGFDTARATAIYEGPLRHAIHRLKYGRSEPLGAALGAFLANRLVADELLVWPRPDAVAAVPIHAQRLAKRGFNQAATLGSPVADLLGVPFLPRAVVRARRTPPQVGLSRDARLANLADAFVVPDPAAVAGKTLLLIDDVFTTGTTASACAHALKNARALRVDVATLAAGG